MADAVVANASPLILLSRAGYLDLLRGAGASVVVPRPVLAEIETKGPDDVTVQAMSRTPWLTVVSPAPIPPAVAAWDLGAGESSVLAWGLQHVGSVAVLDDLAARRCADSLRIPVVGTVGIVLLAKLRGALPLARPLLEKLVEVGMYLSARTLAEALRRVGE